MSGSRCFGIHFSANLDSVKTTIDIPDNELKEAMQHAQVKTKRDAVLAALREYNRLQRVEKIIAKFGTMDGIMTQAELAKMREMD